MNKRFHYYAIMKDRDVNSKYDNRCCKLQTSLVNSLIEQHCYVGMVRGKKKLKTKR